MGDHKGKPVKLKFMTSARGKVRGRVLLNVWERRGPPMLVLPTTMLLLVFLPTTGVRTKVIWGNNKGKPIKSKLVISARRRNRRTVLWLTLASIDYASDDKSDDDKSDKRGQQSNGRKKAGTHANKPKDGEKKQGNEAINDGNEPRGREERPARKVYLSMLQQICYDQFQHIQIECF
jgi:hypothetical protein